MKSESFDWRPGATLLVLAATAWTIGCDGDGDATGPSVAAVAGVYEPVTLRFDPQGSAPPADILGALVTGGVRPDLNIATTGDFDVFFRDPTDGNLVLVEGTLEPTNDGVRLTFDEQSEANQVLLPRILALTFDEEEGTLSFDGTAEVSRARLLQLFPDIYADEQFFDPTPGTLTVVYTRVTGGSD